MLPETAMRRALAQARRAEGTTFPNPTVGAVVVRGGRVLGSGFTRPPGGAHAEVVALAAARRRHGARALRGASLAVTLEPCPHQGRTGPCTEAILEAGIARVWIGVRDPSPWVGGGGARRLRAAGVEVVLGVLAEECAHQHRGFLTVQALGRPWVELKLAATLDGRIATAGGESRWITGPEAREVVHRLRARVDAVVVGSRTVCSDDPTLTARRGRRVIHRPVRVVVDSKLRVPPEAKLFRGDGAWVLCAATAPKARRRSLEAAGARLLDVPARRGRLDLKAALRRLAREGLTEVLVEGGGELAAALLAAGLVDEMHWFAAPRLLGGDGLPALAGLGVRRLARAPELEELRVRRVGRDVHWVGRPRVRGRQR